MLLYIKASSMKVSNLPKLSVVLRSVLKRDWNRDIWLLDSKNQVKSFINYSFKCFT